MTPELRAAIPTGIKVFEEELEFVERLLRLDWKPDKLKQFEQKRDHLKLLIDGLKQSI